MKFMETSVSPSSSLLHPVSPFDIKKEKVEISSPSDCESGLGNSGVCTSCGELITERYLVQVSGRTWHSGCLRCCVCRAPLDGQPSCFVRGGSIYCRADYARTFGAKCARCGRAISATDWVRRAREHVYHLACFACDACRRQLSTGEEFALHEGRVLCKTHYLDGLDAGSTSSDETDPEGSGRSKSKRVRTTFTEEQLHILQANFLLDSNPDGQDLERIANLTGLSKRVTQVWFQNMRARHKKHLTSTSSTSSSGAKSRRNNNTASASAMNSSSDSMEQKRLEGNSSADQPGYSLHLLYSYTMQTPDGGESSNDSVMRSVRGDM